MSHNKCQITTKDIKEEITETLTEDNKSILTSLYHFFGYKNIEEFIQDYFLYQEPLTVCKLPSSFFNENIIAIYSKISKPSLNPLIKTKRHFIGTNLKLLTDLDIMFHEFVIRKCEVSTTEELGIIVKKCEALNHLNMRLHNIYVQEMIDFYYYRKKDLLLNSKITIETNNPKIINDEISQFRFLHLEAEFEYISSNLFYQGFINNKIDFEDLFFYPSHKRPIKCLKGNNKASWFMKQYLIVYFFELSFFFKIIKREANIYEKISSTFLYIDEELKPDSLRSNYNKNIRPLLDSQTMKPVPGKKSTKYNNLTLIWDILSKFKPE